MPPFGAVGSQSSQLSSWLSLHDASVMVKEAPHCASQDAAVQRVLQSAGRIVSRFSHVNASIWVPSHCSMSPTRLGRSITPSPQRYSMVQIDEQPSESALLPSS